MDMIKDSQLAPARKARFSLGIRFSQLNRSLPAALVLAGVLTLAGSGYYGWQAWSGAGDAAAGYATAVAQRGDLEDTVTATGILQPRDYVDVGTQVSGQVKKLHIEIGSTGEGRPAARRDRSDRLHRPKSTRTARSCAPRKRSLPTSRRSSRSPSSSSSARRT